MKLWRTLLILLLSVPAVWAQRSPRVVDSLTAMVALPRSLANPDVLVQGANGGSFKWVANSTTATNAADVLASPYGAATGRYVRQPMIGGAIDLGSAGLTFDGGTYDYNFTAQNMASVVVDGRSAQLIGLTNLTLDGQRDLSVFGRTNLYIWTPQAWAFNTATNRVLALRDANSAQVEYIGIEQANFTNGTNLLNALLIGWASANAYTLTSASRDVDGVITTATIAWPDGSSGLFTTTTKNSTFLAVDAYTVTHAASGKTLIQSTITRDSNGLIVAQPPISVTP